MGLLSLDIAASAYNHREKVALSCHSFLIFPSKVVFKLQEAQCLLFEKVDVESVDLRWGGAEFRINDIEQFIRSERKAEFTAFWNRNLGFGLRTGLIAIELLLIHNKIVSWCETKLIVREMDDCVVESALLEETVLDWGFWRAQCYKSIILRWNWLPLCLLGPRTVGNSARAFNWGMVVFLTIGGDWIAAVSWVWASVRIRVVVFD